MSDVELPGDGDPTGPPPATAPAAAAPGAWYPPPTAPTYGYPAAPPGATAPSRPRSPWPWLALAAVVGLLGGLLGGGLAVAVANRSSSTLDSAAVLPAAPAQATQRPANSVAGVAARVLPTVVSVSVQAADGSGDTGSGFVIRRDGYILTNNHVVVAGLSGGAISVTFSNGRSAHATLVGHDSSYDLAVLKVDASDLPTAVLGHSATVQVGDPVVAIGSPLGLSGTVTSGIVSAKDRPVSAGDGAGDVSYISAIQTDAAINPGNSGGPLVDMAGEVIGVNSSIATLGGSGGGQSGNIGLGFAIPIDQARPIAAQIIRTGSAEHPIIGVQLDIRYSGDGAKVASAAVGGQPPVVPGGPADQAGIEAGDVIVAVDSKPVTDAEELIVAIRSHRPGDQVTLTIRRGGQTSDVTVTLGSAS
jgi:putative serine protease PepD